MAESATFEDSESRRVDSEVPAVVDWIAAAVIALSGMALTVGGSALTFVVGRDQLEAGVESGQITVVFFERDLTEAETLEVTLELVTWTGWGLLSTGVGLVLVAFAYVILRHRTRRRTPDDESAGSYLSNAVLGAVLTDVVSFIPFSPVIGGAAAGYLERDDGGRTISVGALSGFLAVVPALAILVFVTIGLYAGLAAIRSGGMGIVAVAAMLFALLFTAAYGAGLGALGGFVADRIPE